MNAASTANMMPFQPDMRACNMYTVNGRSITGRSRARGLLARVRGSVQPTTALWTALPFIFDSAHVNL